MADSKKLAGDDPSCHRNHSAGGGLMGRRLIVVADDYGIGPATSAGILHLCRMGAVTGTVLLVNSPFAVDAVRAWHSFAVDADLGWHPCLTIDRPVAPADRVASLTMRDGSFPGLGRLMAWLMLGRCRPSEVVIEFRAQLHRFRELTGHWPQVVNSHHHIQIFPIVGAALRWVLREAGIRPYLRRIHEPCATLRHVPGARAKRTFLSSLGGPEGSRQAADDFPGNDALAGITNPSCVHDSEFFSRWLANVRGDVVELTCHPGDRDETLFGRDATPGDGNVERRVQELVLLSRGDFAIAVNRAGFQLTRPSELLANTPLAEAA
jgi:chitin disaccharide deacetylase